MYMKEEKGKRVYKWKNLVFCGFSLKLYYLGHNLSQVPYVFCTFLTVGSSPKCLNNLNQFHFCAWLDLSLDDLSGCNLVTQVVFSTS